MVVILLNERRHIVLILLASLSCFSLRLCSGEDRITFSSPIKDSESETLLCNNGIFRFGFFTPVSSTGHLRYVGIWYDKVPVQTVVWVANKETPINDTTGVVSISEDGNLVVKDGLNRHVWSTNVTAVAPNATWVQLMGNGNLRLQDNREILWESFKHNYNTLLPRMNLRTDHKTGENLGLTSWKSYADPSTGNYTVSLVPYPFPELLIKYNNVTKWRSGPWNGQVFIGLPDMDTLLNIDGFNLNNDNNGTVSLTYANDSFMYHITLDPNGAIYQRDWRISMNDWRVGVRFPSTDCDSYSRCGPYGSCNPREILQCQCVKGFVPRNNTEWTAGNWIHGCVRRAPLRCQRLGNSGGGGGKGDGFLKLQKMKVPVNVEPSKADEEACPKVCLDNCSCTAYAYDQGIGCMLWSGDLVDMQSFVGSGIDLYIRLAHSELKTHSKRVLMITASTLGVAFVAAVCILIACREFKKRPAEPQKDRSAEILLQRMEALTSGNEPTSNQANLKELPLFQFQVLATATYNFSQENMLGQGGFGPVYKGVLSEGQEIAVKRLSRASGQGLEELLNEVVVISKLQHRNLVKLLGCCIEGEERLLVYEYMPKKSLDAYLFDPLKQKILDWKTRFNIMEGICRGLLYLHRDSRLKIIHRDLKASNILLDENLNPKISDFGLARVFRANEDEANTRRIVGTYGYMSPEYAMEGLFSEKSDVFSLGVIFLQIISGRRNSHKEDNDLNLLAYAWKLWNEGEAASLADPVVFDECFEKEITKCVQIGLLCVQEFANNRPNVSTVIWMLTTENMNIPKPKQPAFIAGSGVSEAESSDQIHQNVSINDVSLTAITGLLMVILLNRRCFLVLILLLTAFSCFSLRLCFGEDRITFSTPIKDSETLLCNNGIFRFGFFTPLNSTTRLRYVGIWYDKVPVQTVVWVANKDTPINDTTGVVSISEDGNLVVTDGRNRLLWSTNVTVPPVAPNATWVQLMDTGNLRLQDNREILWESFKHPYNSFLPVMTIGTSNRTGENLNLTSWKSYTDPSTGNYKAGISLSTFPQLMIWKRNVPIWRSGPWNGQIFIGLPDSISLLFLDGFNVSNDNQGTFLISYATDSFMHHFNLDPDGALYMRSWNTSTSAWTIDAIIPSTTCDAYNRCGPFASCSLQEVPPCKCVRGFVPRNSTEWNRGIFTNECVRRVPLQCNVSNGGGEGKGDGFFKMQKMKVPANVEKSLANEKDCPKQCLDNCSCTAYAYDRGIGCLLWRGSLVDMQSLLGSGIDLYIRVAHSEFKTQSKQAIMITASVLGVVFVATVCVLLACRKFKKRPAPEEDRNADLLFQRMEALTSDNESASNQVRLKDLPLFEFEGKLPEGQEIAVKRLSRASGQGLEELMNEVVVISKLQHRNLVKLLGCCIEGEERLLVYEYMPKKSLDAYLFDPLKQNILDWKTRFNIMEGICRGLLYLHRDSRLKIIHRDLKASNILLDENLNPKISDFGLARFFRVNVDEANTRRVVGTYGYMSPEYAMEGFFSEKSDVFSLVVIFLEIISGRKNSHKEENNLNLLAYAWKLWNDGEAASLADPTVFDECFEKEITKCVQIGLLCVQEVASDRPNVSTVIWMLTTENTNLPEPKQPAFIARRRVFEAESSDQSSQKISINGVNLTAVTGR
ncbi:hypothetical protein Bca52824_037392 [Brassica carinata]|uniref:non-specific serine/threonine protein kinase n=1 Tax=Brassica carinata TaxID=52824 RepID=A0A8X7S6P1_BRACI|nr:hypothetical protein Bca52824_037392 [Brassica carinata]